MMTISPRRAGQCALLALWLFVGPGASFAGEDNGCDRLFSVNRIVVRGKNVKSNLSEFLNRLTHVNAADEDLLVVLLSIQSGPKETMKISTRLEELAEANQVFLPDDLNSFEQFKKSIYLHVAVVGTKTHLQQFLSILSEENRFYWAQLTVPSVDVPQLRTDGLLTLTGTNGDASLQKIQAILNGDEVEFLRLAKPQTYFALVPAATIQTFFENPQFLSARFRSRPVVFFEMKGVSYKSFGKLLAALRQERKMALLTVDGDRRYVLLRSDDFNELRQAHERRAAVSSAQFETPIPKQQIQSILSLGQEPQTPPSRSEPANLAFASEPIATTEGNRQKGGTVKIVQPKVVPMIPMADFAATRISTFGWLTRYNKPYVFAIPIATAKKGLVDDLIRIYESAMKTPMPQRAVLELAELQDESGVLGSRFHRDPVSVLKVPQLSGFIASLVNSQRMAVISNDLGDDVYVLIPAYKESRAPSKRSKAQK
jgi:hypothetical protein